MTRATAAPQAATDFTALHRRVAEVGPDWIREFRSSAMARLTIEGLPHSRLEAWRNTSIAPILQRRFEPCGSTPELTGPAGDGAWVGRLADAPADLAGEVRARLGSLAGAGGHPFTALNGALLDQVTVVFLPDGATLEEPLEIAHQAGAGPGLNVPRTLVIAGDGASAPIIETFRGPGDGGYLTCAVTEIFAGRRSDLQYYRVQREDAGAFHIGRVQARVDAGGSLLTLGIALGADLDRVDAGVELAGAEASCEMDGLFLTDGSRHVDNRTRIEHAEPNCRSRQMYKGILAGRSTAVFVGRVIVRPGAQQTDADQSNPNLLLTDDASVYTRPQLEIYADDVRCTHGATVGQLDPDALFYLRSRGIDADEAGRLLVNGFAGEILDRIGPERLRRELEAEVADRLPQAADREG